MKVPPEQLANAKTMRALRILSSSQDGEMPISPAGPFDTIGSVRDQGQPGTLIDAGPQAPGLTSADGEMPISLPGLNTIGSVCDRGQPGPLVDAGSQTPGQESRLETPPASRVNSFYFFILTLFFYTSLLNCFFKQYLGLNLFRYIFGLIKFSFFIFYFRPILQLSKILAHLPTAPQASHKMHCE